MRPLLTLTALLAAVPAAAAPPREPMDEAIDRGLRYLRQTQQTDGGWPAGAGNNFPPGGWDGGQRGGFSDPAVTALAVMAFLSAGHVPGEGRDGAAVERGIRFVMNTQQPNGVFASQFGGMTEMYYHGICTLMLAEAAGMADGRAADELRQRLEAAVKVILHAQRKGAHRDNGGWRYQVNGWDADLSVTGWQLMALRAARNIGCDIPAARIRAAVEYIQRCHDPVTGGYRYTTASHVTIPCTGTGVLALELCGKEYHRSPEALRAGAYILKNNLDPNTSHFFYGVYYTSQGMFQLGDNYWKSYRPRLHELLLRSNPPRANGEWTGHGGFDDNRFGPCYCTAMAILALTVEYRYLPIYQRFEEPVEKEDTDR